MSEVSNDLRTLASMELPPKEDRLGRNVVKFTILCFVIAFIGSLSVVTYALFASLSRESDLKTEIGCVRQSAVNLDEQMANSMGVVIDKGTVILTSLRAVAENDDITLETELDAVDQLVSDGESAKIALDKAVAERQEAVQSC